MNRAKLAVLLLPLLLLVSACNRNSEFKQHTIEKGTLHIRVRVVGRLRSSAATVIGCPFIPRYWNYTISFMAPEGKEVKQGENILGFDTKELMERMQLKRSELKTARKELEKIRLDEQEQVATLEIELAEAEVNRGKALRQAEQPEEFLAMNEVKKARLQLQQAEYQKELTFNRLQNQRIGMKTRIHTQENKIRKLEREVGQLQRNIVKLNVKAPKGGMLVYGIDWRGNKKAVGDSCWIGEVIMELPDLNQMEVALVIPEPQAGKVKVGLPVEIRLDSNPDRVFKGEIKKLGRIFRTKSPEQPAVVFDAVATIAEPDPDMMRPGMAAGVDIMVDRKEGVVQVPEKALLYLEEGVRVWKKSGFGKHVVPVSIGARSGGMVEILEGVDDGDVLLIPNGGEKDS
jgi:multidrug efflux pump subunit AcrA (membrane-fusion protein)